MKLNRTLLGLGLALAIAAGCSGSAEKIERIRREVAPIVEMVEKYDPIKAETLKKDLRSGNLEKVCLGATSGIAQIQSYLMHSAGYEFTPGGGHWYKIDDVPSAKKLLEEAHELEKKLGQIYSACREG